MVDLDAARQPVVLGDWAHAWIDPTGLAGVDDVSGRQDLPWSDFRNQAAVRLPPGGALWLRFMVPAAVDEERWYVQIPSPSVDAVTLYTRDSVGGWSQLSAGTRVPVDAWPVPGLHPLLPMPVSAEEPRGYLLRIQSSAPFIEPVRFVSESFVSQREQRTAIALGSFLGLQLLIALLMTIKGIGLQDRPYALGVATVLALTGSQAAATGIASLHGWSQNAWLAAHGATGLALASLFALVSCTLSVLSAAERWPRLNRYVLALCGAAVAGGAALLAAYPEHGHLTLPALLAAGALVLLLLLLWALRHSAKYVRHLLVASLLLVASAVPAGLHLLGFVGSNFWTRHGLQFGAVAYSLILFGVLSARTAQRRENMRRILGLDRMDPGTGLVNRYEFSERLLRLTARSQRLRYTSAVFVVEVTNMEQLAAEYGRMTTDEMPLRVSRRLLSTVRDIDTVARIGECRFGLLVEGPLSRSDATSLGPRLVARCLMPFRNKPERWVPRVRVAQALVPFGDEPATAVVEHLEDLLASVPADSRKSVFTLNHEEQQAEPPSLFARTA